ncbi:MAG: hypothetical protein D6798_04510 [Deltaproteobacteria bacterium]|nr:MAG: hypothetical protein D6798_04510 [Deltaproteobacteria bacterium]
MVLLVGRADPGQDDPRGAEGTRRTVTGGPASTAGQHGDDRVGRTSLLLVPIALLSRGLAFAVPAVIALWFGVGPVTDAWYWSLALPTFTLVLASTALGTAAIPALARVRQEVPARLPIFIGSLQCWAALGSGAFGLLVCLLAGPALAVVTEFPPETVSLARAFLWELVPFMVLTTAGAVARVANEVHGNFVAVAMTPMVRAGVVIASTWLLLAPLGPHALPWGLVLGEAVQFLFWWGVLGWRDGVWPRPSLRLDPALLGVGRDLAPILAGEVLVALNLVVDKAFAAMLPPGSVATLEFADRARVIPQTLLESTLLMVAYARWSNLFAAGRRVRARAEVARSLRWVIVLAAPMLAGMFIGRQALVALLFQRGAFQAADTLATARVLGWYLPGVLPNLVGILAVRAHIVERNLRLVLVLGVVSVVVNLVLDALLLRPFGLAGLALSTTLNMTLVPGLYLWALRRTWAGPVEAGARRAWGRTGALLAASVAVAAAVELTVGPPASIASPALWIAALPCLLLLALGWQLSRTAPATVP